MATSTEGQHDREFLVSEANGNRSRENVTVASGQNLAAGAVVGKITSGGKYAVYNNGASDGTQAAAGVLLNAVDATSADTAGVVIIRDAEVNRAELVFASGTSTNDQDAAIADLLALGIIARAAL